MTVHRYHPDTNDDPEATLYDDCEQCATHAERLTLLDRSKTGALWIKMLRWVRDDYFPVTENERYAMRQMEHMAVVLRNLGINPERLPRDNG